MINKKFVSLILIISVLVGPVLLLPSKIDAQDDFGDNIDWGNLAGGIVGCFMSSDIGSSLGGMVSNGMSSFTDRFNMGGGGDGDSASISRQSTQDGSGAGEVPVYNDDADLKERDENRKSFIIDCLIWLATRTILEELTGDSLEWVNTGYSDSAAGSGDEGEPFYVKDPYEFYQGVEDEVTEQYIDELGDALSHSPSNQGSLSSDITNYLTENRTKPTLEETMECESGADIGQEYGIDEADDGWNNFFQATSDPACLPTTQYQLANDELNVRLAASAAKQEDLTIDGYLPERDEDTDEVTTPSNNIQSMVDRLLEVAIKQLEDADEISELSTILRAIINAIFSEDSNLRDEYQPD